ncbi:M14 family zinc carboxypeptidase [Kitasatospora mediocidica]|uniref:M14 family zinc carboxypeptidase n=1 Tax=Kitasatospora mediocidica TaxID=58352 RepID=UPI000A62563F|nr:M14 family zinc carboxypeptidase [Kitasatospora mediocidica]
MADRGAGTLRRIGESAQGRPLWLLSLGQGERDVLVVAGAHANEPVGAATALRLARWALGGRRARWHFLLCLDPDGAALTEGWLRGPLSLERHYAHFFRPPAHRQPEWVLSDPPPPETAALLRVIDELRPALQLSLHGVDLGGSFLQLTRPVPGLARPFERSAAAAGLPLDVGSADAAYWPSPSPGIYLLPGCDGPERFAALPEEAARSTWTYAGLTTAVVEVPMWVADGVSDGTPHPDPRGAVRAAAERLRAGLAGVRVPELPGSALAAAAAESVLVGPGLAEEWERGDWARTVAQVTAVEIAAERIPLRVAAALARLDQAGGAGVPGGDVAARCARLRSRFGARWVPVEQQVAHQARTVVATARAVLTEALRP